MLPEFIKQRVEMRFSKEIRYPKDCDALAASINKHCGEKISATTLMRLFGLMKSNTKPRLYTLDLIAQYCGFENWDAAIDKDQLIDYSDFELVEKITIGNLKKHQVICIKYTPDRVLRLEYLGEMNFLVKESHKSKLLANDIVKILKIESLFPLVCEDVLRDGRSLGKFIGGKGGGIQHISIEN